MISSSSSTGGGPSHIFLLEKLIRNKFDIFFAMPSNAYCKKFKSSRFIEIEERKLSIIDIFRLIQFIRKNSIDIIVLKEKLSLRFNEDVNLSSQKERIIQKIENIKKQLDNLDNKLKNKAYLKNAPKEIVQNDKKLLKELIVEDKKLRSIVSSIN